MRRPTPQQPAAPPEPAGTCDAELAIHALHGILTALDWIDDGHLDDRIYPVQIEAARTQLILAGRVICERTRERF